MATSILLKFLTLKWNISRTTGRIEVGDGSLFCIFHALSFERNFFFDRRFPLNKPAGAPSKVGLKTNSKFSFSLNAKMNENSLHQKKTKHENSDCFE